MTKKAFIFIAEGFEEIEAIGTIDILRRAGIDAQSISIHNEKTVTGAHGMPLVCDKLLDEVITETANLLVLPGGMPGAQNLKEKTELHPLLLAQDKAGKPLAAICAAPMVFGSLGLLQGRKATCYPSFEGHLTGAEHSSAGVVVDQNIVTGKGPAFVFDFALALIEQVMGSDKAQEVAEGLLLR